MKRFFMLLLSIMLLSSCSLNKNLEADVKDISPAQVFLEKNEDKPASTNQITSYGYNPLNFEEQKAVWISYIDLASMFQSGTEVDFKNAFSNACSNIKSLGCNTIYVHVRAFGDAYYKSKLFTWSKSISGEIGAQPQYDPLKIMVKLAHDFGLSFHAWINPLRCETEENMSKISSNNILRQWQTNSEKYDEYLVKVNGDEHYWLNPAIKEVRNLISEGAKEIVENYDVDGIHIDDYFYPTTETYFDAGTYVEADVKMPLDDWRLSNCTKLVKEIHDAVKSVNSKVLFGVSPQGNIENNYEYMYADVKKWCSKEGYIDYIAPQVYFGYKNTAKPFDNTIREWSDMVTSDKVSLVIGLAPYKIGSDDEYTNNDGIIAEQIKSSKRLNNYSGFALYNYINIFTPNDTLSNRMSVERDKIKETLQ